MNKESNLFNYLDEYLSRVEGIKNPEKYIFTLQQLRDPSKDVWVDWEDKPGIYYFLKGDTVIYIGKASLNTGLGSRVRSQINAWGDPKWDIIIQIPARRCGIIAFDKEDWYWAASLEIFLIDKLGKPEFNKRL